MLHEEEDLIIDGVSPIGIVVRTRPCDEIVIDSLFQQRLMKGLVDLQEEILLTTINDYRQSPFFHPGHQVDHRMALPVVRMVRTHGIGIVR